MNKLLAASSLSTSLFQYLSYSMAVLGILLIPLTSIDIILILICYFLYSCLGITIAYHRYWSHKSFKTSKFIIWTFTIFGILAGRGSTIGWAYVHRNHHKYSDTVDDPHDPETYGWRIFFPHLLEYGKEVNRFVIKDLLVNKYHILINRYYNLLLEGFILLLLLIDVKLFFILWAIPVALTSLMVSLFVYLSHLHGYVNFKCRDDSKNNWVVSLLLWGEGWHNNHHRHPDWHHLKVKWWEFDPAGRIIKWIKK